MPVTRRRRATSPEQPENNNQAAQVPEQPVGSPAEAPAEPSPAEKAASSEQPSTTDVVTEPASTEPAAPPTYSEGEASPVAAQETTPPTLEAATQERGESESVSSQSEAESSSETELAQPATRQEAPAPHHRHETPASHPRRAAANRVAAENIPYQPLLPSGPTNGERQDYVPTIESGRRTARGELFRRPPQPPVQQYPPQAVQQAPLQAPTHEISLPLGNLLHLAYNPGYTGSDEARSALLHQLEDESKAGGRARCWSCGSLAIVYDRWNTRSKTFGEIGVAYCEICGVWSVM